MLQGEDKNYPRRQRRLNRIFESTPSYFITLCSLHRAPVLDRQEVFDRLVTFASESLNRYGVWLDSCVIMPDHIHVIATFSARAEISLGAWIKAFKAVVGQRQFQWQPGFFDHVLRSEESRSEKWEYIRRNPVRAGLTNKPEDWPFALRFCPRDGRAL